VRAEERARARAQALAVLADERLTGMTTAELAELTEADRVLVTVVYLRQLCSMNVLSDLLGVNANSIARPSPTPANCWPNTAAQSTRPRCALPPRTRSWRSRQAAAMNQPARGWPNGSPSRP
jgi:hypothetical protein